MSTTFTLIVCILGLLFASWLWSRRRFYRLSWKLSGPIGLPFIGVGLQIRKPEKLLKVLNNFSQQYKSPFIMWFGPKMHLYVNDPVTVETVFQSTACTNKGDIYRLVASAIGDGLFTSSSPRWNKHRRLLNPAFGRKTVESFLPIFNAEIKVLVAKLAKANETPLELYGLLKKSVLEVACQTTMGQKMNFHDDCSKEILDSYNIGLQVGMRRLLSPWLYPNLIYRFTNDIKIHQKCITRVYDFIEGLLRADTVTRNPKNDKITTYSGDDDDTTKSKSKVFIDCVRSHIQSGQLTFEDVRDEANVAMGAAFDTTSTALYFTCLCLALHPEHQDRLYDELIKIFPNKDLDVTLEDLDKMTYTDMVINEGMRLFSPVPVVLRSAATDFQLKDGTVIPKGTQIVIDIYNMHRSTEVWGPNALSYDPEGHFGGTSDYHPYAFIPFTKGLRMCIGYRYAVMMMKVVIAKIFLNFRVHSKANVNNLPVKGALSLKLAEYPLCTFHPR